MRRLSSACGRPSRPWRPSRRRGAGRLDRLGLLRLVVAVAADRAAELADPLAQRAAQLGRRFGPKTTRAMIRTIAISRGPMFGIAPMVTATAGDRITVELGGAPTRYSGFFGLCGKVRIESPFRGFDKADMRDASASQTKTADRASRLPGVRLGAGAADPLGAGGDRGHWRLWRRCPECDWHCDAVHGEARDRRLRRGARHRHPALSEVLKELEHENMQYVADTFAPRSPRT